MPSQALIRSSLTLLFSVLACLLTLAVAGQVKSGGSEQAVAQVGDQTVTFAELEQFASGQLAEIDRQRHQLLERSLDQLVDQRLIEFEAQKREISVEKFVAQEIESKVDPVTDADVDTWYNANQQRVRQPKEQVADQIRSFLGHQRSETVRRELLAKLRGQHPVKVLFEPMRLDVDLKGAVFKGQSDAPVTLVEYSDFECPACKRLVPSIDKLAEAYPDRVRIAFKQFPLHSIHPNAQKAAEASLCADEQGKFWPMHDSLFERQRELSVDQLKARAEELKLDTKKFNSCLDSDRHAKRVLADMEGGQAIGVGGTPTLFINGRPVTLLRGSDPFDQLSAIVEDELSRLQ